MSKSAEFPHSTSSRLLPKESKNSAEKKNREFETQFSRISKFGWERKIGSLQLQPLFFYGYENKSYKILPQGDKWNYKFPTYMEGVSK